MLQSEQSLSYPSKSTPLICTVFGLMNTSFLTFSASKWLRSLVGMKQRWKRCVRLQHLMLPWKTHVWPNLKIMTNLCHQLSTWLRLANEFEAKGILLSFFQCLDSESRIFPGQFLRLSLFVVPSVFGKLYMKSSIRLCNDHVISSPK
jgi:hypothetical protein